MQPSLSTTVMGNSNFPRSGLGTGPHGSYFLSSFQKILFTRLVVRELAFFLLEDLEGRSVGELA